MWRASFKFLISSYDSYCHCEKASFGECLALVSVQGSWVYLLSEPLKAWWLNVLLSVARRESEASIFVPLWFLMRNAVSFSVTFDFGFNSSFMTKRKTHTKQNTSAFCQGLFFSMWSDCSYRLVGVEKARWEIISMPSQQRFILRPPQRLGVQKWVWSIWLLSTATTHHGAGGARVRPTSCRRNLGEWFFSH